MRNSERIPGMINLLYQAWVQNPDLRLAQLVSNAASLGGFTGGPDAFHCEDDTMAAGLTQLCAGDVKVR